MNLNGNDVIEELDYNDSRATHTSTELPSYGLFHVICYSALFYIT